MSTFDQNPNLYRDILQQLPGLIVVMDLDSTFVYSNDYTAQLFGYEKETQILGLNAHGMHCPAGECADDFIKQDRTVIKTGEILTILDIHTYANDVPKILLTKKSPLHDSKKIVGTICHCTEIHSTALKQAVAALIQSDKKYFSKEKKAERSYCVGSNFHADSFTKREQDCLFYLLRGKTMKQIAQAMSVSSRTVETHLEHIKDKLGCFDRAKVVDYALSHGYLNYIPQEFMTHNVSDIIHTDNIIIN